MGGTDTSRQTVLGFDTSVNPLTLLPRVSNKKVNTGNKRTFAKIHKPDSRI